LATRVKGIVMQNNAIDIFETYFGDVWEDHIGEEPSAKTVTIFRDPNPITRGVSKICWHPDSLWKLAVSYCTLQFQKMPENIPLNSYIWDVTNPNSPDFTIKPQSPLVSLVYNPKSTDNLAGGCYNGLIGLWDLRKGETPVAKTLLEQSHSDPVYDIYWIQSRTGTEFCSVSTDGYIYWWDVRKLGSGPIDSMILKGEESGPVYGATCLEYRTDAGATRFLIGTEQGILMTVERKAKKDQESQKSVKALYGIESGRHHGTVLSVERNYAFPKYILTVGDWAANIWMEDIRSPILSTPYDSTYLTAGAWSPTRPGVFYTTKKDGVVDIWDYYYKQTEPIVSLKVAENPLTCISLQQSGKILGIGSQDGATAIMEVCPSLVDSTPEEKPAVISMFDRETNREKNLQNRLLTQRRQLELEKLGKIKKKEGPNVRVPFVSAEKLKESENKFWTLVTKHKPKRSEYELGNDAGKPDIEFENPELMPAKSENEATKVVQSPSEAGEAGTQKEEEIIPADNEAVEEATKIEGCIDIIVHEEQKKVSGKADGFDSNTHDAYVRGVENSKFENTETMKSTSDAFFPSQSYVNKDDNSEKEVLLTKKFNKSNKGSSQATCQEEGLPEVVKNGGIVLDTPIAQDADTTKSKEGESSLSNKEPIWKDPELVE